MSGGFYVFGVSVLPRTFPLYGTSNHSGAFPLSLVFFVLSGAILLSGEFLWLVFLLSFLCQMPFFCLALL